jgi:toxin YoeB
VKATPARTKAKPSDETEYLLSNPANAKALKDAIERLERRQGRATRPHRRMGLIRDEAAWEQHLYWQETDRAIVRKINMLLKELPAHPFRGHRQARSAKKRPARLLVARINQEHRLVYKASEDDLRIAACRFHYGDK